MKEPAEEMCIDDLQKDKRMVANIIEVARSGLNVRSNDDCKLVPIGIHKI
jgi:hypothetical protein